MKRNALLASSLMLLLFLSQFSYADLGPKPVMHLTITQNGALLSQPFDAKLLGCSSSPAPPTIGSGSQNVSNAILAINQYDIIGNCYWKFDSGVWGGCIGASNNCTFDYFLPSQFKVAVYAGNNLYISPTENLTGSMQSYYSLDISTGGFTVNYQYALTPFIIALIVTLLVEEMVGLLWLKRKKADLKKGAMWIFIANVVSLVCIWFGASLLINLAYTTLIVADEVFAVLIEGLIYFLFFKSAFRGFSSALAFSIVLNVASFAVGFILFLFIPFIGLI
ncbi:MAG: hypothetical protein LVQ95_05665 [Candidatus Micrarchaeales archaeon]|nr:hypothetical protein [Candidatus Micrarchaeales archaeon]